VISVMREEVTGVLNIGWNHAGWMMITADGNQSDLTRMAKSMRVNLNGIVIHIPLFVPKS